jgi:hypothetical protein
LTKKYVTKAGKTFGGMSFKNTQVRFYYQKCTYMGRVSYKGELYDGLHEAIIDEDTFNKAQSMLAENRVERKNLKE